MWIKANQTSTRLFWMRLLMLISFVTGQTPLLPAAVGAALMMEGSHAVEIQSGGGQCLVQLHHSGARLTLAAQPAFHHHGWVSRLLVSGAADPGSPHPDHILGFRSETVDNIPLTTGGVPAATPILLMVPETSPLIPPAAGIPPMRSRWALHLNPKPRHSVDLRTIVLRV
jgi:hypothetical protein